MGTIHQRSMPTSKMTNYRDVLLSVLTQRKSKNQRYSLRAFARDLGIASSRLSEIMNGKVGLSAEKANEISSRLNLSDVERSVFYDLVESEHSRSAIGKKMARQRLLARKKKFKDLTEEKLAVIGSWYHLALLELIQIHKVTQDPVHLEQLLGVPSHEIIVALERLVYLNMAELVDGRYKCTGNFGTAVDVPSAVVRKMSREMIEKALLALQSQPVQNRDITSIIFKYDKKNIPQMKERIRAFMHELASEFEVAPDVDAVAGLNVQLFPLSGE